MGLFIGLKILEKDLEDIKNFQETIKLKNPVKSEEMHCTLFTTTADFNYISNINLPIEIQDFRLGKIKTQTDVDCLVLYFRSEILKNQHDLIKNKFNVMPYYEEFIPHITLSYDCGSFEIEEINIKEYIKKITFTKEYVQDLKFEVNKRKKVRN